MATSHSGIPGSRHSIGCSEQHKTSDGGTVSGRQRWRRCRPHFWRWWCEMIERNNHVVHGEGSVPKLAAICHQRVCRNRLGFGQLVVVIGCRLGGGCSGIDNGLIKRILVDTSGRGLNLEQYRVLIECDGPVSVKCSSRSFLKSLMCNRPAPFTLYDVYQVRGLRLFTGDVEPVKEPARASEPIFNPGAHQRRYPAAVE